MSPTGGEYQRELEKVVSKKNGEPVRNEDIWALVQAGFHDNARTHEIIRQSLIEHCSDPRAHETMRIDATKRVVWWSRDRLVAPIIIAIIIGLIARFV